MFIRKTRRASLVDTGITGQPKTTAELARVSQPSNVPVQRARSFGKRNRPSGQANIEYALMLLLLAFGILAASIRLLGNLESGLAGSVTVQVNQDANSGYHPAR